MFLSDIISSSKKQIEERKSIDPVQNVKKKYVKRGEIEASLLSKQREEEMEKTMASRSAQKTDAETAKEEEKSEENNEEKEEGGIAYSEEETIKRLRARGQVVTFFGELPDARLRRLHKLEDRERLEFHGGAQNEVGIALRKLEEESEENENKRKRKEKEKEENQKNKQQKLMEEPNPSIQTKEAFVLISFKRLLRLWNEELEERTEIQKRSSEGKKEQVNYIQTKKNISPLFKLLAQRVRFSSPFCDFFDFFSDLFSKSVDEDMLQYIHGIALNLKDKEYVKAHDAYLRMAIGNAPWPMGVTMVGIHERSAREKINSGQVAHVLNDEVQRKYIQSVKRLMTFCQKKFPTDPSKTVG
eukprot:TRINITY_DN1323_c0_g3_i2.p1 TRINITY_DN1323_c0_g3~~TRINITY_DN1323_c0_g3_i2.p1  ORF type:complete len:357 (-),score=169.92 TRINITY_DN1323_c0_g3_i2:50-1120(-)